MILLFIVLSRDLPGYKFSFSFNNETLRQLIKKSVPLVVSRLLSQANIMIDKMMASFLLVGSISILSWSYRIYSFFYQVKELLFHNPTVI